MKFLPTLRPLFRPQQQPDARCWCMITLGTGFNPSITSAGREDLAPVASWYRSGQGASRAQDLGHGIAQQIDLDTLVTARVFTSRASGCV